MEKGFTKWEERVIANIAVEQTENIILTMADIVIENRNLREEVERLRKVEEEYHQYVADRCRAADEASRNMIKAALVGVASGKGDMELARELVEFM